MVISMLEKVAGLFIGIVLIIMGVQAFFVGGYWSKSWGRYMDYGPYHQLTGVFFVAVGFIVLGFTLFRDRKRQFRSIKKKYGIPGDNRYSLESITRLLLRFNQMVETPLLFDDYAIIRLNGVPLPLLYGSVGYTSSWWVGIRIDTRAAIYLLVEDDEVSKIVQKHQDLFELATRKEDITVFFVRHLRKLNFYLKEQDRAKSARIN
jgi:hypothetical protein